MNDSSEPSQRRGITAIRKDIAAIRRKFRNHRRACRSWSCCEQCWNVLNRFFKTDSEKLCQHGKRWGDEYCSLVAEAIVWKMEKDGPPKDGPKILIPTRVEQNA